MDFPTSEEQFLLELRTYFAHHKRMERVLELLGQDEGFPRACREHPGLEQGYRDTLEGMREMLVSLSQFREAVVLSTASLTEGYAYMVSVLNGLRSSRNSELLELDPDHRLN